jgi:hypothetical protein
MHAQAIINAPMTNTKSEPIANLRSQGIISLKMAADKLTGVMEQTRVAAAM